ncbi:MAG: SDR family oxidoreductase [Deltaproteobacteria bacterium]|nr:SDR family oxidoreductase [Deltaproteobacteria bacterium]
MIRLAAPLFWRQGGGVIVNTGAESGLGHPTMANYAAAKEGILGLTRSVARALGRVLARRSRPHSERWRTRECGAFGSLALHRRREKRQRPDLLRLRRRGRAFLGTGGNP